MFYILFAGALGYLIVKKLDESDLYITKTDIKSRHKYREVQGVENIVQGQKPEAHTHEIGYTKLGIPIKYHKFPNGTIVRTYGLSENQFNLTGM